MTISASVLKSDGNPSQFGTSLGDTTLAEPGTWTRITALNDLAPQGGARLTISSDAAAIRFAVMQPQSSQATGQPDIVPRHNGRLLAQGQVGRAVLMRGAQIWVKTA